jgi:hypothetical protein
MRGGRSKLIYYHAQDRETDHAKLKEFSIMAEIL